MGYRPKPKQYRLKFADAEFEGLEVIMGSMSVGEWSRINAPAPDDAKERAAENAWSLEFFASRIISWNLTEGDDDRPVPVTVAALQALPRPFLSALLTAWQLALLGVDPTSAPASSDGGSNGETVPEMPQTPLTADDLMAMGSPGSSGSMT